MEEKIKDSFITSIQLSNDIPILEKDKSNHFLKQSLSQSHEEKDSMQHVKSLHMKLNQIIDNFQLKLHVLLDIQRGNYLNAYEDHIYHFHSDIYQLKQKLEELMNQQARYDRIKLLEIQRNTYRSQTLKIDTDYRKKLNDLDILKNKVQQLQADKNWIEKKLQHVKLMKSKVSISSIQDDSIDDNTIIDFSKFRKTIHINNILKNPQSHLKSLNKLSNTNTSKTNQPKALLKDMEKMKSYTSTYKKYENSNVGELVKLRIIREELQEFLDTFPYHQLPQVDLESFQDILLQPKPTNGEEYDTWARSIALRPELYILLNEILSGKIKKNLRYDNINSEYIKDDSKVNERETLV